MKIGVKVDSKQITMGIINATRSGINANLHKVSIDVRRDLRDMVDGLLKRSPEYVSLTSGVLKGDFGIDNPEIRLDEILAVLKDSVHVSVTPATSFAGSLRGGINVGLIASGFNDILNLPAATVQREKFDVPWLNWLITRGDSIIVSGYHVEYNLEPNAKRNSMSGVAIMARGGGWRVPPQFSGTLDDNWLTRTFNFNVVKNILDDIVQKSMMRHIK